MVDGRDFWGAAAIKGPVWKEATLRNALGISLDYWIKIGKINATAVADNGHSYCRQQTAG